MILRNVNFVIQKEGQGLFFLGEERGKKNEINSCDIAERYGR